MNYNCNCTHSPCTSCSSKKCDVPCACPAPFLGIEQLPDHLSVLRFNLNGVRADYDFDNLIYTTQSDTSLAANAVQRVLTYMAERHMDTITAQELGAILHLADLGDVTTQGAEDGSMLTYQKSNNCSEGCVGTTDTWKIWNALDQQSLVSSATYPMAFNTDGKPRTIQKPANPSQYYMLGWNAGNQLSYSQIPIVATAPVGTDNKKIAVYVDPNTNQLVGVKE